MVRCVLKGLALLILAAAVILGAAVLTAPRWLPGLAQALLVQDPLRRADLIVVLSGSVPDRPRYAADLYHAGFAPRLLCVSALIPDFLAAIGRPLTHAELSAEVLRAYGVPDKDILVLNRGTSTYEELGIVTDTMRSHGWKRVILVSSPTHLRRVRMTWDHLTRGAGPDAILRATPYSGFHAKDWWHHESDLVALQNEYLKIGYYLLFTFRDESLVKPD
jgi:uncharacterized SAM-binding protein YcdF (DUF218 family)